MSKNIYIATSAQIAELYNPDYVPPSYEEMLEGASPCYTHGWPGEKNGMYGKKLSVKHKKAISEAAIKTHKGKPKNYKVSNPVLFGASNPRSRKIYAEGKVYNTIKECQTAYGLKNHNAVRYRLNHDKWTEWYYLD